MSAFIVCDWTVAYILKGILEFPQEARLAGASDTSAVAMRAMNMAAVNYRYNENSPEGEVAYIDIQKIVAIQLVKYLDCYLHQCSEGKIPENYPLFERLNLFRLLVAHQIVKGTEEYKEAEWG